MLILLGDEGAYTQILFDYLPSETDLISGSSMPIRDVDTFFRRRIRKLQFLQTEERMA